MKNGWLLVVTLLMAAELTAQDYEFQSYEFQAYDSASDYDSSELLDSIEPQLQTAPPQVVAVILEDCKTWAAEDDIEQAKMATFLLDCVNESLGYEGYLPVGSIKQ